MSATYLYRLYDEAGQLLYIGISNDPMRRGVQHRQGQPWAYQVRRQEWSEPYPDRQAALDAERAAIKTKQPRYNVVHGAAHPIVIEEHVHRAALTVSERNVMECPRCGCDYTHVEHVNIENTYEDRPDFVLDGWCEDGCAFRIAFRQYKGDTVIETTGVLRK